MNIKLLNGSFDPADAIRIITSMIEVKIKFHEDKIQNSSLEEDIKMRENRIRLLQKDQQHERFQLNGRKKVILDTELSIS
jgi:hypothetical protein